MKCLTYNMQNSGEKKFSSGLNQIEVLTKSIIHIYIIKDAYVFELNIDLRETLYSLLTIISGRISMMAKLYCLNTPSFDGNMTYSRSLFVICCI